VNRDEPTPYTREKYQILPGQATINALEFRKTYVPSTRRENSRFAMAVAACARSERNATEGILTEQKETNR